MSASTAVWPPHTFLGHLDSPTGMRATQLGRQVAFRRKEVILREGERSEHLLVLLSGVVKIVATTCGGREVLLSLRVSGDVVGELAAMDGAARIATVIACGPAVARKVSAQSWRSFLDGQPAARVALSLVLAERLRMTTRRQIDLGGCTVGERVARVLADFSRLHGRDLPGGRDLGVDLTQPELAAAAGCAEASVHKALMDLRRAGVIVTRYRRQIVVDAAELDRRAGIGGSL